MYFSQSSAAAAAVRFVRNRYAPCGSSGGPPSPAVSTHSELSRSAWHSDFGIGPAHNAAIHQPDAPRFPILALQHAQNHFHRGHIRAVPIENFVTARESRLAFSGEASAQRSMSLVYLGSV